MAATQNLVNQALALSMDNSFHTKTKDTPFPLVPRMYGNKAVLTREADDVVINAYQNYVSYSAGSNLNASALGNGGNFPIIVPRNGLYVSDQFIVHLTVQGSASGSITFANILQCLNYVSINPNGSSNLGITKDGDNMYLETAFLTNEQFISRATLLGLSSTWGTSGTTLASNTSFVDLFFELDASMIEQCRINFQFMDSDTYIWLYFQPWSKISASTATPTITYAEVLCSNMTYDEQYNREKISLYKNPVDLRYLTTLKFAQLGVAMTASQTYTYTLSTISGMAAMCMMFLRPTANVGTGASGLNAFTSPLKVDIQTQNGVSIVNYLQTNTFNQAFQWNRVFPNTLFSQYNNCYLIQFGLDPQTALSTGSQTGFYPFSTKEKVVIYTPSGLTSTNYDIVMYFYIYNTIELEGGAVKLKQ